MIPDALTVDDALDSIHARMGMQADPVSRLGIFAALYDMESEAVEGVELLRKQDWQVRVAPPHMQTWRVVSTTAAGIWGPYGEDPVLDVPVATRDIPLRRVGQRAVVHASHHRRKEVANALHFLGMEVMAPMFMVRDLPRNPSMGTLRAWYLRRCWHVNNPVRPSPEKCAWSGRKYMKAERAWMREVNRRFRNTPVQVLRARYRQWMGIPQTTEKPVELRASCENVVGVDEPGRTLIVHDPGTNFVRRMLLPAHMAYAVREAA